MSFFKKILFIYSRETHRERQRHRQREKQAPCREACRGTRSWVSRITPWAEGGTKPLSHQGCPLLWSLVRLGHCPLDKRASRSCAFPASSSSPGLLPTCSSMFPLRLPHCQAPWVSVRPASVSLQPSTVLFLPPSGSTLFLVFHDSLLSWFFSDPSDHLSVFSGSFSFLLTSQI